VAALLAGTVGASLPAAAQAAPARRVIDHPRFADAAGLLLNGTAVVAAGRLQLTSGGRDQAGAAWSTTTIDPHEPFDTAFDVSMTDGTQHADGVAFVLQTDGPRAIGGHGGSIGYGGMTHSVAVEFDTYRNPDDPDANHVAVVTGGRSDAPQPGAAPSPIALFGRRLHVRIGNDPRAGMMTVALRGDGDQWTQVLRRPVDLAALGAGRAYAGLTAATGASTSTQTILRWTLDAGGPSN
jgi:hypothetical protein